MTRKTRISQISSNLVYLVITEYKYPIFQRWVLIITNVADILVFMYLKSIYITVVIFLLLKIQMWYICYYFVIFIHGYTVGSSSVLSHLCISLFVIFTNNIYNWKDNIYLFERTIYIYLKGQYIFIWKDNIYLFERTTYIYLKGQYIFIWKDNIYLFERTIYIYFLA